MTNTDITDKSAEEFVQELVQTGVFDSMGDGVSVQDTKFKILYQNSKHVSFVGAHAGEYCYEAYEKQDDVCEGCPLRMSFKDGLSHTEERTAPTDKGLSYFEITASALKDKSGNLLAGIEVARDITSRKMLEDQLRATALTDDLTGLLNRRGFFALADQQSKLAVRNRQTLALVYVDLNDLKKINDKFGHVEGDRALQELANLFMNNFRESDIVGRIGGDEFAILLTESGDVTASSVRIDRLLASLDERNRGSEVRYELAIATGIVYFDPENPSSIDELLNQADRLMYQNKLNKTNPDSV